MKNIETIQREYIEDLNKQYLYWKNKYEENPDNYSYLDMVNLAIYNINHFDESYINFVEQESKGFLSLVLSRIRKYEDPFYDNKSGYTRLGFKSDDVLVAGFIKQAIYVKGFVSEDKVAGFITSVKKELVNVDNNSKKINKLLEESKQRMQDIKPKVKVKGTK